MNTGIDTTARVLLVGPSGIPAELSQLLQSQGWICASSATPMDALRKLRNEPAMDMVLVIPGPLFQSCAELCRSIKFDPRTGFLSVIFLVAPGQADVSMRALENGADDCMPINLSQTEILMRLRKAIRLKKATDSLEDAATVITALANAVEGKDAYTCGHVERVGAYSIEIGKRVGVDADGLAALQTGGIVHDIGKVGTPDHILNKPGKLTDEELAIMQRHPVIGYDILKPLRTFHNVLPIVRWHHERPNGTGYPDKLAGDQLPLLPRIAAVADVFDALSTDRPYRPAFPMAKCKAIMMDGAAKGDLDMELVKVLYEILGEEAVPSATSRAA